MKRQIFTKKAKGKRAFQPPPLSVILDLFYTYYNRFKIILTRKATLRGPMELKSMLADTARRYGRKTALVMGGRQVTFAELEADSNRVARALMKMGVKKGDRVATIQASNPEFVSIFFGIIKAGGIAVPLDARYVPDELVSLFNDCQPQVLVIEDPPLQSLMPALDRFDAIKHIITVNKECGGGRFTSYRDILAKNPPKNINVPLDPEDIAIISYTGGPTLDPHGVALSHQAVYTEVINSAATMAQTEKDVMVEFALPMYHQFGLTAVMLASIYIGNKLVVVPGTGRSIDSFMEAVAREKGTIYCGVPYIYSLMTNVARREGIKYNLSSVRLWVSGGAPLEPAVVRLFKQHCGFNITDVYGQTETVCHITMMPMDGSGPVGSSGKPLPCWEIKIFDENDNELPPGEEGEIVTRGPVMSSFYRKPEATARVMRNGWLHTGDTGTMDEEGFLYISGRQRRMVILKGQNIFPADIEAVLAAHPKIAAARVMGNIDLVRGETVKALVKLKPGATTTEHEIRQYCQGRMADYKLPREIEFVETMPKEIPLWRRPKSTEIADLTL
jgi:long-chain acyl-CoA synthetase